MAIVHWFALLVAGSSQMHSAVTPTCYGQDLAVPLCLVNVITNPRGGTQLPQH